MLEGGETGLAEFRCATVVAVCASHLDYGHHEVRSEGPKVPSRMSISSSESRERSL